MSSDVSAVTKYFARVNEGFSATTSAITASGATEVLLGTTGGLTDGSVFVGLIEPGVANKEQAFTGTVDLTNSKITGVHWTKGTNTSHAANVTVVDYTTGTLINMINAGILKQHNQDGSHAAVAATSVSTTGGVTAGNGLTVSSGTVTAPTKSMDVGALNNPYMFSAYRTTAWTASAGGNTEINLDAVVFDPNNNYTTLNGYTAPFTGYYFFTGAIGFTGVNGAWTYAYLFKNDGTFVAGNGVHEGTGGVNTTNTVTGFVLLNAGDKVKLGYFADAALTGATGAGGTFLSGFLVSRS